VNVGVSLVRAFSIALAGVMLAAPCAAWLAHTRRPRWAWSMLLAPLLTPSLLIGYAYINFATPLVQHPHLHHGLYVLLVLMKFAPIAVLIVLFAPAPALTDAALHSRRLLLLLDATWLKRAIALAPWWLRGPGRIHAAAFAALFLLTFAEFELASIMEITKGTRQAIGTWTVAIMDAQLGGTPLSATLRAVAKPVLCEAVVLGVALALLLRRNTNTTQTRQLRQPSTAVRGGVIGYMIIAIVLVTIIPLGTTVRSSLPGWAVLRDNPQLLDDLLSSTSFAALSAVIAFVAARLAMRRGMIACLCCLPGLLGSLALGLALLAIFQPTPLYDTIVPLLCAIALFLLPIAVVMSLLLRAGRRGAADHAIDLLARGDAAQRRSARRLVWQTRLRRASWTLFLLFYLGFLELPASALLAPTGMTPVTVRLYNQMHFRHSDALSALVIVAMATPVIMLLAAATTRRIVAGK
jgi:ABC-type Fe3+ transport system permease subunit